VEVRSLDAKSRYIDWALSLVQFGRPLGAVLSGLLIKRYAKFKVMLRINVVASMMTYLFLAAGWIRKHHLLDLAPILTGTLRTRGPRICRIPHRYRFQYRGF